VLDTSRRGTSMGADAPLQTALHLAQDVGLRYTVSGWTVPFQASERPLLEIPIAANSWVTAYHRQYVTNGSCNHCGLAVPVVTLSPRELAGVRCKVERLRRLGWEG
jgi:hypothetical protein